MIPPQTPRRGDLVWLDFTPQAGHEPYGRRPAIILSPENYNRKTGLAIACPITNQAKGYPFEVVLPANVCKTLGLLGKLITNGGVPSPNSHTQVMI